MIFRNKKDASMPSEMAVSIDLMDLTQIVNCESSVAIFNCIKYSMSLLHFMDKRSEPYSVRPRLFLVTEVETWSAG